VPYRIRFYFDRFHAATRVPGWTYEIPTAPEQGYYLLQVGAAIAAVLAVLLLAADRPPMAPPAPERRCGARSNSSGLRLVRANLVAHGASFRLLDLQIAQRDSSPAMTTRATSKPKTAPIAMAA
jgi:hypothetical protein